VFVHFENIIVDPRDTEIPLALGEVSDVSENSPKF
jgi:hypothetical protein